MTRAIVVAYQGAEGEIHTARKHASAALLGALRTGACLCEVYRRFGRTGWVAWVRQHCPEMSTSTVYRYRKLALKFSHVTKLEDIPNLRQAYMEVGILPEPNKKKKLKKALDLSSVLTASGTDLASRVHSTWEFLGPQLEQIDPSTLDVAECQRLKQELSTLRDSLDTVLTRLDQTLAPLPASQENPSGAQEVQT